jgi:hypothetical protein
MGDDYLYARMGYDAYALSTGGKTFDGRSMPSWDDLPERIRDAWRAATDAVLKEGLAQRLFALAYEARGDWQPSGSPTSSKDPSDE